MTTFIIEHVPSFRQRSYMLYRLPHDVCTKFDFGPVEPLREAHAELAKFIVPI